MSRHVSQEFVVKMMACRPNHSFQRYRKMLAIILALLCWSYSTAAAPTEAPWVITETQSRVVKREGKTMHVFEHRETQTSMEYVVNSGVCETTQGVKQYSGYVTVGPDMNMFFWFFEARNNASTAPLVAWFNGGPGCSSMIGLFQEHGPCTFNTGQSFESPPSRNPYSWNEFANMLYIDQPVGVGLSYGDIKVDSTESAGPFVWNFLQAFFAKFPEYKNLDFGIFTESYGGHYGPSFSRYIQKQNEAIDNGKVQGDKINLVALGINNGWINPGDGYKAMIEFAYKNSYRRLIDDRQYKHYSNLYEKNCLPTLKNCWKTKSSTPCVAAQKACAKDIEDAMWEKGQFDKYDVRSAKENDTHWPPNTYEEFLNLDHIQQAIGAKTYYYSCYDGPARGFERTGDDSRSFLGDLTDLVKSNITVLLWAGDADWLCNWMGNLATAESIEFPGQEEFKKKGLVQYTVNGTQRGLYKTSRNLSFLKVIDAGHTIPAYQPEMSLQVFRQTMLRQPLSVT